MKKRMLNILTVVVLGMALAACGGNNGGDGNASGSNANNGSGNAAVTETDKPSEGTNGGDQGEADKDNDAENNDAENNDGDVADVTTTNGIVEAILSKVEQPALMPLEGDAVKDFYSFDPALVEEYTIKMPMMNVKTNEIAVFKVKDTADIPTLEKSIDERAAQVQKQFETYLPDQYENAKNYKVVKEGSYVLFVISESADAIIEQFQTLVKE